jgi:hypothetical protein
MAYTLKKLEKAGTGAASPGGRFAYIALVDDLLSFPNTDDKGVVLQGQPVYKEGKSAVAIYLTSSTKEFSYESQGEEDARTHKLKFVGSHPGTEQEALEFALNNLDKDFIVFIPGCQSNEPVKVLGRPCAPLKFKSSHKSGKDGQKFEFTFEQETGSKYVYFIFNGPIQSEPIISAEVDFSTPVTSLVEVQKVKNLAASDSLEFGALANLTAKQVTFLGQEENVSKACTISEDLTAPVLVLTNGGLPWTAVKGSAITFEVYETGATIALIERWRS